jgi:hypothetical protein
VNQDVFILIAVTDSETVGVLHRLNMSTFHCTASIQFTVCLNPCIFKLMWYGHQNEICDSVIQVVNISNRNSVHNVFHIVPLEKVQSG